MLKLYGMVIISFLASLLYAAENQDSPAAKNKVTHASEELKGIASSLIQIPGGVYKGHKVRPFAMEAALVTVKQYKICAQAGVCPTPPDNGNWSSTYHRRGKADYPINEITWFGAKTYCSWLGRRLPSETEWEWVAGGREYTWKYPWGDSQPDKTSACWMRYVSETDSGSGTCKPGEFDKATSRDGVKDMAGNLWQWTSTLDNDNPGLVILKGGAWYNDDPEKISVLARGRASPYHQDNGSDGFRCVGEL